MSNHQRNALPRGCKLGEFRFERVLGSGGFGITYLAQEDPPLARKVAIKEYLPSSLAVRGENGFSVHPISESDKEDFRYGLARFANEASTLVGFRHPNIVPVIRFIEANGTAYMVMEYQEGDSLASLLRTESRIEESRLRSIVDALLEGLEQVHDRGFLHRDIKPENIFIRDDGSPVLLDFGSARQALGAKSQSLTAIVTAGYAPPEQYYSGGDQGPWTDIYGMGATLYRAMTGDPPPEAPARMRADPLVPVGEASKGRYSPGLVAAVDAALRFDESERPQTIAQWRAMLAGTGDGEAPPNEPSTKRRSRRGLAAAIVLALLLGGGAWIGYRSAGGDLAAFGDQLAALISSTKPVDGDPTSQPSATKESEAAAEAARRQAAADETRREAEERAKIEAEARAQVEAEQRAKAREAAERQAAEDAARRKAEAERARIRAEVRAEIEAERKRQEAEEKRKAEEAAAKRRAEAEAAARKAQEEARREAEEQARRQATVSARHKAEEEAKRQAEARRQAEVAAQRKAAQAQEDATRDAEQRAALGDGTKSADEPEPLPDDLQSLISGNRIFARNKQAARDEGWIFGPDGRLSGSFYRLTVNQHVEGSDNGRWWIENDQLCLHWDRWYDGKARCYDVVRDGTRLRGRSRSGDVTWSGEIVR